jgi:hypothetical protein
VILGYVRAWLSLKSGAGDASPVDEEDMLARLRSNAYVESVRLIMKMSEQNGAK